VTRYCVILFHSASHAVRAEKVLLQAGLGVKMIPTPRQISSDCGMALRLEGTDEERVVDLLERSNVPINGIHRIG
jgi:uncharacterized SAM-binding protein YcdF (DUF218 family)